MLSPKEKAIELYKYYNWELMLLAEDPTEVPEIAKKCAIKCVDEIIDHCDTLLDDDAADFTKVYSTSEYFIEVKDELNKLSI